jgi:hypothetical protein
LFVFVINSNQRWSFKPKRLPPPSGSNPHEPDSRNLQRAQHRAGQPYRHHPTAGKRRRNYDGAAADHPFHVHDEIALLRTVVLRAATAQPRSWP